jgi:hypothetical protein
MVLAGLCARVRPPETARRPSRSVLGMSEPGAVHVRGRIRRAIAAHLGSRDVARVIYGSVIGLALVVALETHPPAAGVAVAAMVGTAVTVGLADVYSELIGSEARTRERIHLRDVGGAAEDAAAVIFGAAFPAVFFVLAGAGAIDLSLAFKLAKWTGLGLICAYGFAAGRVSGYGVGGALVHSAAVGAIGGVLIGLKALVH